MKNFMENSNKRLKKLVSQTLGLQMCLSSNYHTMGLNNIDLKRERSVYLFYPMFILKKMPKIVIIFTKLLFFYFIWFNELNKYVISVKYFNFCWLNMLNCLSRITLMTFNDLIYMGLPFNSFY
jgi:hypothetical protein